MNATPIYLSTQSCILFFYLNNFSVWSLNCELQKIFFLQILHVCYFKDSVLLLLAQIAGFLAALKNIREKTNNMTLAFLPKEMEFPCFLWTFYCLTLNHHEATKLRSSASSVYSIDMLRAALSSECQFFFFSKLKTNPVKIHLLKLLRYESEWHNRQNRINSCFRVVYRQD